MLKCRDIALQASDYLDRSMSLRQRTSMAFHMLMCGNCRAFVRHMRLAMRMYRNIPAQQLSDEEAAAIVRRTCGK